MAAAPVCEVKLLWTLGDVAQPATKPGIVFSSSQTLQEDCRGLNVNTAETSTQIWESDIEVTTFNFSQCNHGLLFSAGNLPNELTFPLFFS